MRRPGRRGEREQQRQAAEQHREHGEQPQGQRELGAHERAHEQVAHDVLLVEGAQRRAAGRPAHGPGRGDPHALGAGSRRLPARPPDQPVLELAGVPAADRQAGAPDHDDGAAARLDAELADVRAC